MINAIFPEGLSEVKLPAISQWDYNRKLSIAGLGIVANVLQVHFSNTFTRVAIVRVAYKEGETWQVNIPNALLQERYDIYAYIYLNENESGKTVKKIIIPVNPRKKPDDYAQNTYEEEELNRLIDYTNKLGGQVSRYANILADYKNKKWVKPITKAEYNALVDAGTVENDVLYCFTDVSLSDSIAESLEEGVKESIRQGIEDGTISIGAVETAAKATEAEGLVKSKIFSGKAYYGSVLSYNFENGYRYAIKINGLLLNGTAAQVTTTAIAVNNVLQGSALLEFNANANIKLRSDIIFNIGGWNASNGAGGRLLQFGLYSHTSGGDVAKELTTTDTEYYIAEVVKLEKVF